MQLSDNAEREKEKENEQVKKKERERETRYLDYVLKTFILFYFSFFST